MDKYQHKIFTSLYTLQYSQSSETYHDAYTIDCFNNMLYQYIQYFEIYFVNWDLSKT